MLTLRLEFSKWLEFGFVNLMPAISGTCQFSPVPQRSVILIYPNLTLSN